MMTVLAAPITAADQATPPCEYPAAPPFAIPCDFPSVYVATWTDHRDDTAGATDTVHLCAGCAPRWARDLAGDLAERTVSYLALQPITET